jgi:hypothetical protein
LLAQFADDNTHSGITTSPAAFPRAALTQDLEWESADEAVGAAAKVDVPGFLPEMSELGSILEVHRTPAPWGYVYPGMGLLLLVLAVILQGSLFGWRIKADDVLSGALTLSLFAVWLILVSYALFRDLFLPLTVLVFQHGLVKIRGRRIDVFVWSEVQYLEGVFDDVGECPGKINRHDGRTLAFKELDPGSRRKLDELARREVWERQFSWAEEKYLCGETVRFGPLGVNKLGLEKHGKILAWEEIARIKVELPDLFIVRRRGSFFYWFSKRIGNMPNFFILRHFIEKHAIIDKQR